MEEFKPRYIVTKAEGVPGPPIPADEPCLVIRGQDALADFILGTYINRYVYVRGEIGDEKVVEELRAHRRALRQWQAVNKVKYADRDVVVNERSRDED